MKRLRLVRVTDPRVHHVTHQVVVGARHPVKTLRRWWPLVLMLAGVVIALGFMVNQQLRSASRGQDVSKLASAVETQNTALASVGLPTVDPSTVVSNTSDLPTTSTTTVTVTAPSGLPTGAPPARPPALLPAVTATYTTTVNGVPVTVTTTLPPVTVTGPGATVVGPGQTVTTTATSTTTVPGPETTVTATEVVTPPPVTVTETATSTVTVPGPETTVTVTADPPPSDPNPEESP